MDPRFEAVQSDDGSCLRCLHSGCVDFAEDHTWHYHPEYELTWIMQSSGTRFVGDSIERYGPGDLVLIGPDLPHCWYNDSGADEARPEAIVVQFDGAAFGAEFFKLPEVAKVRDLLERSRSGLHFRRETAQDVGGLLRTVVETDGMARLIRFLQVLEVLAASHDSKPLAQPEYQLNNDINPVNRERIELVHQYVHANLDEAICQADIARRLGLSPSAFSRFFRAATGKTFVGFVNLLRVNHACRLLTSTTLSVTRIAVDCGYDNISNFNRQFLALKGMNPTEYRLRARTVVAVPQATSRMSGPRLVAGLGR